MKYLVKDNGLYGPVTMEKSSDNDFYEPDYEDSNRLYFDSEGRDRAAKIYANYLLSLPLYCPCEGLKEGEIVEEGVGFYKKIQDLIDGEWVDRIDGDYINFNANPKKDRRIIAVPIDMGCQCDACKNGIKHKSDCAVHNEPAMPNSDCDCGAVPLSTPQARERGEEVMSNRLWIKIGDDFTEIDRNVLGSDVFDVDFNGHYLVQITNDNGSFSVTNAMNGYGNNCRDEFIGKEVTFLTAMFGFPPSFRPLPTAPAEGERGYWDEIKEKLFEIKWAKDMKDFTTATRLENELMLKYKITKPNTP